MPDDTEAIIARLLLTSEQPRRERQRRGRRPRLTPEGFRLRTGMLESVAQTAARRKEITREFHEALIAAYRAGISVRAIGMAAGLSPTRVWEIVSGPEASSDAQ